MHHLTRYLVQALILIAVLALVTMLSRWVLVPSTATDQPSPLSPNSTPTPPAPSATAIPPTPTPSMVPTETPTPGPSATPTATPTLSHFVPPHATVALTLPLTTTPPPLPMPTAMPVLDLPEEVMNIVLLGTDTEAGGSGWRTDVIVVVSVNPDIPSVSLLSIPRDLYVWVPGYGYDRINTADRRGALIGYPGGGPALVKATIEYNLGIPIHYYARVDFDGFVRIVDTLGGIDIPIECELHDTFPDPANPEQGIDIDWVPGIQHMDGRQALWYVRSRWSTHDFDRNRRQQQVLRALFHRVLDLDIIPRIPELWGALRESVETDLGLEEMIRLGLIGSQLDLSNVKSRFISSTYLEYYLAPNGAHVLLPLQDALAPVVAEAMQPPAAGRAYQPPFRVEVWDGTGQPGLGAVAAERLRWEGFEVVGLTAVDPVSDTQVLDLTTTDKGSPLWLLTRLYQLSSADIISQPTEGSPVDLRIILGADYNPCVPTGAIYYVPPPTPTPTPTPGP